MPFLNGSTAASQYYHQWDVNGQVTFDFTALTDSDNVTLAEFRIYGWTDPGCPHHGRQRQL